MSVDQREATALVKKLMDAIDGVEEHEGDRLITNDELLEEARAWLVKNGEKDRAAKSNE